MSNRTLRGREGRKSHRQWRESEGGTERGLDRCLRQKIVAIAKISLAEVVL